VFGFLGLPIIVSSIALNMSAKDILDGGSSDSSRRHPSRTIHYISAFRRDRSCTRNFLVSSGLAYSVYLHRTIAVMLTASSNTLYMRILSLPAVSSVKDILPILYFVNQVSKVYHKKIAVNHYFLTFFFSTPNTYSNITSASFAAACLLSAIERPSADV